MTVAAPTAADQRRPAIYQRLVRRNRLVRVLRFGLPAIGAIILLGLLLQIYIGSVVPDFGFASVTIDRENLVVEAPVYAGVGTDGTTYAVSAAAARTAFGNIERIDLTDAMFSFAQPGNATSFTARAGSAQLQMSDQTVTVAGVTEIESGDGMAGTVLDARLDVDAETMYSEGAVDLTFANGSTIVADSMTYDGAAQVWTFQRATVQLESTPGEAGESGPRTPAVETAP